MDGMAIKTVKKNKTVMFYFQLCVKYRRSEEDAEMSKTNFKVIQVTWIRNVYENHFFSKIFTI